MTTYEIVASGEAGGKIFDVVVRANRRIVFHLAGALDVATGNHLDSRTAKEKRTLFFFIDS